MCNPFLIGAAMAGTQIAGQQMSAKKTNEASERNANAMIAQASAETSSRLIQQSVEAGNTAREVFGRDIAREESLAQVSVAFGDIIGTPRNDTQRSVLNSAMDAEWQLAQASELNVMKTQEDMSAIFVKTASGIASLPTVGTGEQVMGAVSAGVQGYAWGYKTDALLKAAPNPKVIAGAMDTQRMSGGPTGTPDLV